MEVQVFKDITLDQFEEQVKSYKERGWRFANLCGTTVGNKVEVLCSFVLGEELENLSLLVAADEVVPAVSPLFPSAFLNENETSELFGVKFKGITLDYGGSFYPTSVPTPMNPTSTAALAFLASSDELDADASDTSDVPDASETLEALEAPGEQAGQEASHG